MESVHSLQLKFNIAANCSIIMGDFKTFIGKHKSGSLDSELELHRCRVFLGYHITTSQFFCCMQLVDKHGKFLLCQLTKWAFLVLNARSECDSMGESNFVWDEGQQRSVLDLVIAPKDLSADIEVSQVWDAS